MSKPGRPNLSLAGKREAPIQPKQARGGGASSRGAGRGRGGRGRGAGGRARQELIQTGGVFSEGLGGEFPNKKKEKLDTEQYGYTKRESGVGGGPSSTDDKQDGKKEEVVVEGKASFEGWDELWRSDDEADERALRHIHPKGFISDLKKGSVMPVVLPLDDQSQFRNVIEKSARLSLEDVDEADFEEKKATTSEARTADKRKTPEQLIRMLENSRDELLHLQLPSVVAAICNAVETTEEAPMEVDDPDDEIPAGIPSAPAPPSGLPQGRTIGKLQVTQNGRLILRIGEHSIDLTSKPTEGKQQGTVLLEVDPSADQPQAPSPFSLDPPAVENSLYHLGNVKYDLVGSMSWSTLNDRTEVEEVRSGNDQEKEMREDIAELDREKLQKLHEEQASWANLAARWATGLPS